jgi:ABC-type polysaccharide/polyol phosphate export permease
MNPLYYFVNIFRGSLSMEVSFLSEKLLYAFLFSLASLSLGWLFYDRYKDRIPYYL